jgi:GNAT superfamily N-acetyltransferase
MKQRVDEAATWAWVPSDAQDYVEVDYRLTIYPHRASVQWSTTSRPLPELIAEVRQRAREAGHSAVRWWLNGRTAPANTADVLEQLGFELIETVQVLALELRSADELVAALELPEDVIARPADDADSIYLAGQIDSQIFGWPPPTRQQLKDEREMLAEANGSPTVRRYLAYLDEHAVGSAGYTLADDVLRLWGAGVLPEARGRGAYRALLAARCADGIREGATLALVKGRTDTSAPVLRRAGFTSYGIEKCYQGAT